MKAARRDAGGFVLVTVLWAVAALAVLAGYIDGVVTSDLEHVIAAKRSLAAELERRNTETTLIYLFATGRMNHLGLILEEEQRFTGSLRENERLPDRGDGELRMTGDIYAGLGGARFSIQDEGRSRSRSTHRARPGLQRCSNTRVSLHPMWHRSWRGSRITSIWMTPSA